MTAKGIPLPDDQTLCAGCVPYQYPNGPIDHEPGCTVVVVTATRELDETTAECACAVVTANHDMACPRYSPPKTSGAA